MSKIKYFPKLNITVLFDWYTSGWMRGEFDLTAPPKFHHIPVGKLLLGERVTIYKPLHTEMVEHNGHTYLFERGGAHETFKNLTWLVRLVNPTSYYTKLTSETDLDIYKKELSGKSIEQCHFLKALKDARDVKELINDLGKELFPDRVN